MTGFPLASVTATDWTCWVTGLPLASELWNKLLFDNYKVFTLIFQFISMWNEQAFLPVTGFPFESVTATDWTCWVTGLPLGSEEH